MWIEINVRLSEVTDLMWPHGTEWQCANSTLASWNNLLILNSSRSASCFIQLVIWSLSYCSMIYTYNAVCSTYNKDGQQVEKKTLAMSWLTVLLCPDWTGLDSAYESSAGLDWIRISGSSIWTGLDLFHSIHFILWWQPLDPSSRGRGGSGRWPTVMRISGDLQRCRMSHPL